MTCVWNALLAGIPKELFNSSIFQPIQLVEYLKQNNRRTDHIKFNGIVLSEKQKDENFEAVASFDTSSIYGGYYCSFEDPFLFLVAELFQINIRHTYNGYNAEYRYNDLEGSLLYLQSSSSHMNFVVFKK